MDVGLLRWITCLLCRAIHFTDMLCHAIMTVDDMEVVNRAVLHTMEGSYVARNVFTSVLKAASKLIVPILDLVTPEIRAGLVELVYRLEDSADETPNQFDNMLIDMLKGMLAIPDRPKEKEKK